MGIIKRATVRSVYFFRILTNIKKTKSSPRSSTNKEREPDPIAERLKNLNKRKTLPKTVSPPSSVFPLGSNNEDIVNPNPVVHPSSSTNKRHEHTNYGCHQCLELKNENERLNTELQEVNNRCKELLELNMKYQHQSIALCENIAERLSNINEPCAAESEPRNPLLEKSARIGQLSESGDQVHVGDDEWIELEQYRELMLCRKKTSIVYSLLKYLFTNDELKQCTVTGKVSNRKRVQVEAEETREVEKLDSRRVLILTEFLRYYCIKELGMNKWEAAMEITSVPSIISTRLAAIRYEPAKKLNGSKKRKKDSQSVNPNTQDNETEPLDGDYEIIDIMEIDDTELDINNVTMENTMILSDFNFSQ
ncbi:uncharacterized protein LOC123264048 [Cotesia glomerata]|uniref:uncharacterized protein LOC123264048 n=1 Tax=Cotesia glomerata TaxID=32391 RepID=UPI001D015BBF|nr:uncharacterized protein LOC123264048 [Cotesia glomerata]